MDQLKSTLTRKIGPFPGWAWAGLVAVGAFLVWPHVSGLLGSSSSSSGSTGLSGSPSATYPLPGTPDSSASSAGTVPQAPTTGFPSYEEWLHTPGRPDLQAAIAQGRWSDLIGQYQKEFKAWASKQSPAILGGTGGAQGGVGGPLRRQPSIGSRSSDPMAYFHPTMKLNARYPQLVRGMGGPAGHKASVHAAAARTGLHPARLLALNPHYRGLIRVV